MYIVRLDSSPKIEMRSEQRSSSNNFFSRMTTDTGVFLNQESAV